MSSETCQLLSYLSSLSLLAARHQFRFGICMQGEEQWNCSLLEEWLAASNNHVVFQLGGDVLSGARHVPFNKGQRLLGQECNTLICDISSGWDANSFSAALGTLIGGGLLFVLGANSLSKNPADQWLRRSLDKLISISPESKAVYPSVSEAVQPIDYSQQQLAVDNIVKVVTGHRKRPLILTADRGRGKSSALGMAAANLMFERKIDIIVTAPSLASVSPVFQFAQRLLDSAYFAKGIVEFGQSSLRFIAPDELLKHRPECDLLLVDEAAALPLPMLQTMVNNYHRAIFSSTIHGYEGCGRGFSLKFQSWLKDVRPNMKVQNMDQPIRWSKDDPLEAWHNDSFLLNYEFQPITDAITAQALQFRLLSKQDLLNTPQLLHNVFSLLVNAHYQTSPNDLFHLLGDENVGVYIALCGGILLGCILSVKEGGLDELLIKDIQQGKRRPKGHLVPVSIANQLGIADAAKQVSYRIMRIAVHPDVQNRNIGAALITHFSAQLKADYLSTSFGATPELVRFWQKSDFQIVKVGSMRDQASGCYSLLMIKGQHLSWLDTAKEMYRQHLDFELSDSLQDMEPQLVRQLVSKSSLSVEDLPIKLIENYAYGGSNYESVALWIRVLACTVSHQDLKLLSDVFIAKVVQRQSWDECAKKYQLSGRKQIESLIRKDLSMLLLNLQCKVAD
ncbi:MAG: tRNA(Met) cytidine acetyltransferase TmcA [Vibrio sp.]|uniref:tRNA(Met) cytidine acetyltransferase TmcA n=1 Tax=Vibrio sp. TaxID=678 RepID=UPI003A88AAE0